MPNSSTQCAYFIPHPLPQYKHLSMSFSLFFSLPSITIAYLKYVFRSALSRSDSFYLVLPHYTVLTTYCVYSSRYM